MRMQSLFALLASVLICTTASGSAPKGPSGPVARPALWKLSDADTTIYLFGTIHVLPPRYRWRTALFNKVAAKADELVLEVNDLDDQSKTAQTFMSLALSPNLPPVRDRVPPEKRAALARVIRKSGMPEANLDHFESWAVAVTLAAVMLKDLHVSPDSGVERILSAQFKGMGKPIRGLETSEWQLGLFDKLSEASQQTFLIGMVDEEADPNTEFRTMLRAWSRGDDKAIALSFDDEAKLSAELAATLLHQRNANWAEWVSKRLEKPGTVLMAVGAGHLAGEGSVQTLLAKRGLKVVRIQ